VLAPDSNLTLRIRQLLPADGLSPGERLLNSRPPLQVGDGFLAEVVGPPGGPPALVVGNVAAITPPGWFGKPGALTLDLGQLVIGPEGAPFHITTTDQRYLSPKKRKLLATLIALQGLGIGASVATQFQPVKSGWVWTGAGIGLVAGVAYATCLPGREASLQPGDTFCVTLGAVTAEQVCPEVPLPLYPAQATECRKGKP
jgi:hypothetical protein